MEERTCLVSRSPVRTWLSSILWGGGQPQCLLSDSVLLFFRRSTFRLYIQVTQAPMISATLPGRSPTTKIRALVRSQRIAYDYFE